jgi:aspartyl-tRNA(Asn)/glutamyl-tRNA(Gln) amidotransferase subunit A
MTDERHPSAVELADDVRAGRRRAREIVEDHLERIERGNDAVNAFVFVDADRARSVADDVDRRVADGEDPGPLAGVPLGIKCTDTVAGWPATSACSAFAERVGERDSVHVARLLAAGAVPVGLTASPPLGLLAHTASPLYGVTRNPWDLARTPGGSSGGASAALAAGLVPLATGSDMGGSIRGPASATGVVGIKPTYGRIPKGPGYLGAANLAHPGPLARSVADLARYLDCTAGPSERDPASTPPAVASVERAIDEVDVGRLRMAWVTELGGARAEPDVEDVVVEAAEALAAFAGVTLVDAKPAIPDLDDLGGSHVAGLAFADRSPDPEMANALPALFMDLVQTPGAQPILEMLAATAVSPTLDTLIAGNHHRFALNEAFAALFEEVDLLLLPTVPVPPFPAEGPYPMTIRGREVGPVAIGAFTSPFNVTGHPAASVPAGLVGGLPVGLQIVGRRHEDHLVLAAAAAFERARPWPRVAPT